MRYIAFWCAGCYFNCCERFALQEEERWKELIDWMDERRQHYMCMLKSLVRPELEIDAAGKE